MALNKIIRTGTAGLVAVAFLACVHGCHNGPCHDIGFDEGESFQITVLAQTSPITTCDVPFLAPGNSFVLVGGAAVPDGPSADCTGRGARGAVPPFATDVLTSCTEGTSPLGLNCTGMTASGCAAGAVIQIGRNIVRGVNTVEHGTLTVLWGASACNSGECAQNYDVRIDRLPGLPSG